MGSIYPGEAPPAPADLRDARGRHFSDSCCPMDGPREGTHALPPPCLGLLTPSGIWGAAEESEVGSPPHHQVRVT